MFISSLLRNVKIIFISINEFKKNNHRIKDYNLHDKYDNLFFCNSKTVEIIFFYIMCFLNKTHACKYKVYM